MRSRLYAAASPGMGGSRVCTWAVDWDATTAGDALGWSFASTGTVATPDLLIDDPGTPATSDFRTQLARMTFTSAATTNATGGVISEAPVANRGSAPGRGGFSFATRIAFSESFEGTCGFVGLSASSATIVAASDPYIANTIGIGFAAGEATSAPLRLVCSGDTPVPPIEIPGTSRDPDAVYELSLLCAPNASEVLVRLVDLRTGTVFLDDVFLSADLPENDEMLYVHAEVGSVASTEAPSIEIMALHLEVPDGDRSTALLGDDGVFSVRDFGAVGNAKVASPLVVHDDLPAFEAALRALARRGGGTLLIPPGDYYLDGDLVVDLRKLGPVLFRGVIRGFSLSLSRIFFKPMCGLRILAPADPLPYDEEPGPVPLDELDAPVFGAEDLTLISEGPRAVDADAWTPNEEYEVGEVVVLPYPITTYAGASFEYYFECIRAGQALDTGYPDFANTFRVAPTKKWDDLLEPQVNDFIYVEGIFDRIFLCIQSTGPRGSSPPLTWPAIGDWVQDGLVKWRAFDAESYFVAEEGTLSSPGITRPIWACRTAPGIYAEARVTLRRVWVQYFFNSAVHLQVPEADRIHATAGWGSHIFDMKLEGCGGGITSRERAEEACHFGVIARPYQNTGDLESFARHHGVIDHSRGGNTYVATWYESMGPILTVSGEDNAGSSIGDYIEALGAGAITSPKFSIWGTADGTKFSRAEPTYGAFQYFDWRGVKATSTSTVDPLDPMSTEVELSVELRPDGDRSFVFASDDDSDSFAYVYGEPIPEWWALRHGSSNYVVVFSETPTELPAKAWFTKGIRIGPEGTARLIRSGPNPTGGGGLPGEIVFNSAAASSNPAYWYYDGTTWFDGPTIP